jgi:alkylation response protein AidB-like acyl-CoA dehydrogenase
MASFDDRSKEALEVAASNAAGVDRDGRFPGETVAALGKSGLLGLTMPVSSGGIGGGPQEFLGLTRALASRCASSAMVYLMHVCAAQVAFAGAPESEEVRAMASGASLGTLAFSERGSRSHFWAPVSRVAGSNGEARLRAEKSFVTSAGHADAYVVATRPAATESPIESSLYLVRGDEDGIRTGAPWAGLGLRGNASAPMTFDVEIERATLIGEEGKGLDLMLGVVLPWFQLGSGAVSLGIAEGALGAAIAHVTSARLEHLDQTLAELPTVRARIGRCQVEIDAIAGFLADLARRMDAGDATAPVLSAKAAANEMAIHVTSEAMQACGGAAMSSALPIERFFRDARAGSVMAPTTDVLYDLTGRALAGMPLL